MLRWWLFLFCLPVAFGAPCTCDGATCQFDQCECLGYLSNDVQVTGVIDKQNTGVGGVISIPLNVSLLELRIDVTGNNSALDYGITPIYVFPMLADPNCLDLNVTAACVSDVLAMTIPMAGDWTVGFLYHGADVQHKRGYVDYPASFTMTANFITATPTSITREQQISLYNLTKNDSYYFSFKPSVVGLVTGDIIKLSASSNQTLFYVGYGFVPTPSTWQSYARGSIDLRWAGFAIVPAPLFWMPCGPTLVDYDPTINILITGQSDTPQNVTISFQFTQPNGCQPNSICKSDYVAPHAVFGVLVVIFLPCYVYCCYHFYLVTQNMDEMTYSRSIACFIVILLSAPSLLTVAIQPVFFWASIPPILLLILYTFGVSYSNKPIAATWGVLSIIHLIWCIVFLLILLLLSVAPLLSDDDHDKEENTDLQRVIGVTATATVITLVCTIANIVCSWLLFASLNQIQVVAIELPNQ